MTEQTQETTTAKRNARTTSPGRQTPKLTRKPKDISNAIALATPAHMYTVPETADLPDYVNAFIGVHALANWVRGDIVAQLERVKGEATLQQFAEMIEEKTDARVSVSSLQEYRKVAVAYPAESRRLDIPWSVHQVFASQDDRVELIADWSGTVKEARQFIIDRKAEAIAADNDVSVIILESLAANKGKDISEYQLEKTVAEAKGIPYSGYPDNVRAVDTVVEATLRDLRDKGQIHQKDSYGGYKYGPAPQPKTPKIPSATVNPPAQPKTIPADYDAYIEINHPITDRMHAAIRFTACHPRRQDWPNRIENSSYPFCPDNISVTVNNGQVSDVHVQGMRIRKDGTQGKGWHRKVFQNTDLPDWVRATVSDLLTEMMQQGNVTVADILGPAVEAFTN